MVFVAALITFRDLCIGLFEVYVFVQQTVITERFGSGRELMAGRALISLPAIFTTVFD